MLSSRNKAMRRTGTYFHSDANSSAPSSVLAPHTTVPNMGNERRQLMPRGFSNPFSVSVSWYPSAVTPFNVASVPAGAFQTPRVASLRANRPATAPLGGDNLSGPLFNGSAILIQGK